MKAKIKGKGAHRGKNEGNRPSKKVLLSKNQKVPRAYESLNQALLGLAILLMLPCVPGIVTFITGDIKLKFFSSFSFALSEPLMLRIYQKFKAQARKKHLPACVANNAGMRSHTHADKIDCFIHIKK
jgi:hypothetical protein